MAKKTFDKAKWLDEKREKVATATDLLKAGVGTLQTSDEWVALLGRVARSWRRRLSPFRYSFGNQLLLAVQRPDAVTSVGSFKAWARYGRSVKKGEKGLMILAPRPWKKTETEADGSEKTTGGVAFGTAYVFDLAQTDGDPLPEAARIALPLEDDAAVFEASFETVRAVALAIEGAPVLDIELRGRRATDLPGAGGWYVGGSRRIVVLDEGSRTHQFKVLVHEVAHALLHPPGDHHSAPEREVEAESVAFVVCHALGLDTRAYSFPYIASWAGGAGAVEMVTRTGDRIVKAATTLLGALAPAAAEEESEPTSSDAGGEG